MSHLKREQFLHKVVAVSGFLFSLCLLPVAQYVMNESAAPAPASGSVAGVNSAEDSPAVRSSVAQDESLTPEQCNAKKAQDIADLQLFYDGKKKKLLTDYEAAAKPYRDAKAALVGTPEVVAKEGEALDGLIDAEYQPYLKSLADVDKAVGGAKSDIESLVCE